MRVVNEVSEPTITIEFTESEAQALARTVYFDSDFSKCDTAENFYDLVLDEIGLGDDDDFDSE